VKANNSPKHCQEVEEVRHAMQQTVERIFEVAGKTNAELADERGVMVSQGGIPQQEEPAIDTASPE
jgi:hypothetical protein